MTDGRVQVRGALACGTSTTHHEHKPPASSAIALTLLLPALSTPPPHTLTPTPMPTLHFMSALQPMS